MGAKKNRPSLAALVRRWSFVLVDLEHSVVLHHCHFTTTVIPTLADGGRLWSFWPRVQRSPDSQSRCSFLRPFLSCFPVLTRDSLYCGGRCSKVPVRASFSESLSFFDLWQSFVGLHPFLLLPTFHPFLRCVVFSVAHCCLLWYSSTSSCNIRPPFHTAAPTMENEAWRDLWICSRRAGPAVEKIDEETTRKDRTTSKTRMEGGWEGRSGSGGKGKIYDGEERGRGPRFLNGRSAVIFFWLRHFFHVLVELGLDQAQFWADHFPLWAWTQWLLLCCTCVDKEWLRFGTFTF